MTKFKRYLLARLKEPSTWYGIIQVAAAFGLFQLSDHQADALLALVSAVLGTGTAAIITPDRKT